MYLCHCCLSRGTICNELDGLSTLVNEGVEIKAIVSQFDDLLCVHMGSLSGWLKVKNEHSFIVPSLKIYFVYLYPYLIKTVR